MQTFQDSSIAAGAGLAVLDAVVRPQIIVKDRCGVGQNPGGYNLLT